MFFRRALRGTAVLALVACATAASAQQSSGKPDMDAMMKTWAKYATPGDAHKQLEKMAGNWSTETRWWMDGDSAKPPMVSKGTAAMTMILGGRFLSESYKGEMMGMPFEGLGMVGYDNFKQTYLSTWTDNLGTGLMMATGNPDPKTGVISMSGKMDEPTTGEKDKPFREVVRWTGPDTWSFEMYDTIPGKGEVKVMEVLHTRAQ